MLLVYIAALNTIIVLGLVRIYGAKTLASQGE